MSQHGCPERLSNRSKGFQDDGPSQPTMEVLVETLTGTAFEMTVLPTDTIFAIKSKIFRVEGIPVSQQHLLYNLKELEDSSCLREHAIGDGARLRLVLGMRGGPISTRRLPPPPNTEPWRDIERLLDTNREDVEWGGSGCKVTVLVFRDGERVNMLRVKENHDGTYSPLEHSKLYANSPTLTQLLEREIEDFSPVVGMNTMSRAVAGPGALHDNAVTMGKMIDLRRRMETLSVHRQGPRALTDTPDKVEIQKTRSEETLSVPSLLEETGGGLKQRAASYAPISDAEHAACAPAPSRAPRARAPRAPRLDLDVALPPLAPDPPPRPGDTPVQTDYAACGPRGSWSELRPPRGGAQSQSASSLHVRAPLSGALFSSSTSELEKLRAGPRLLPGLQRHRPREHLHLSDERLDAAPDPAPPAPAADAASSTGSGGGAAGSRRRTRCGLCRKRLSIATLHRCRCGGSYCAPHRYAEVHGCAYDYRAAAPRHDAPLHAPKLPRI
ncbi:AN1-type zinc finger protein 4 isoform X3 [Spodoptera frugiperda]|uniref:AN1-type zinc finger protein 4 isoform X3 n=1 Tax=Spodoptera frugiperda TaxID=7108 RepID=A0A9R0D8A8_SPOFR|nr:AN1-type zinc finger protein 4 isoform X3 [Spodoptera frugiperda]